MGGGCVTGGLRCATSFWFSRGLGSYPRHLTHPDEEIGRYSAAVRMRNIPWFWGVFFLASDQRAVDLQYYISPSNSLVSWIAIKTPIFSGISLG